MAIRCPHCNKLFEKRDGFLRTLPENRYYWGVVLKLISEHTGNSTDALHRFFKEEFLYEDIHIKTKDEVVLKSKIPQSSATITTLKFEEYLENIRQWASEFLGVVIPLPNEEKNG